MYTEAETGKTKLDFHFSYLNLQFKAFVEDGNTMALEPNVYDALVFNGGILNTTSVLVNMRSFDSSQLPIAMKSFQGTEHWR